MFIETSLKVLIRKWAKDLNHRDPWQKVGVFLNVMHISEVVRNHQKRKGTDCFSACTIANIFPSAGIVMMNVRFPKPGPDRFNSLDQKSTEFKAHVGLFTGSSNCMYTYGIIPLSFPLIHVRVMPQRPQLVCAKLFDSNIVIYDWEDELKDGWSYDDPILERAPMLELSGHETKTTNTSHGLVWNPTSAKEGLIASCDKDGKILVWDVTGAKRKSDLEPIITITGNVGERVRKTRPTLTMVGEGIDALVYWRGQGSKLAETCLHRHTSMLGGEGRAVKNLGRARRMREGVRRTEYPRDLIYGWLH